MTTQANIREWYNRGITNGARFMFVVCDTYDWEDYPSYAYSVDDAREKKIKGFGEMSKIMEIYDLNGDREAQLNTFRNWAEIK
jgi:hypothetical protein